jgi:NADH-quinone oxidoreductase subunit N
MPIGDILPEITVLLSAVAVLLAALFLPRARQGWCAALALVGLGIAIVLAAGQVGGADRLTFQGTWALDGVGTWARLLILGGTAFVVLLSPSWLAADPRHGEFYAILLFSCLGAMVLASAGDLLQLVLGVLLSSVTGYTLAAWHRDWPLSVEAGMKYFLVGALANVVLLIGVTLMFGLLGTSGYGDLAPALAAAEASPLLALGVALVVVGLAFKLGAVPAHAWMPDVAEGAPVPSAAFLTVIPKIGAAVALARLVSLVPVDTLALRPVVAVVATVTMTLGNLAALGQDDVRRLLGWSSVSQSGYALMAVCVIGLSTTAASALLVFLAAYAVATLAAFAVVGHLRGLTDRAAYAGLAWQRPWLALTLIVSVLSLVGIPPLAGFFGKFTLFVTTIDGGYGWLAVVAVANTVVSLVYYLRVVAPMYFSPAEEGREVLSCWTAVAVTAGAILTVASGLAAEPGLNAVAGAGLGRGLIP